MSDINGSGAAVERETVEVIESNDVAKGMEQLGNRLTELKDLGEPIKVMVAYSREQAAEILKSHGWDPETDVPVEGPADFEGEKLAREYPPRVEYPSAESADIGALAPEPLGEDWEDPKTEFSDPEESEVEAEPESKKEDYCDRGDNPLKGRIVIHVHSDGSIGYDIDEDLNEMEIMGACRYVVKVFEELELMNIRGVLRSKATESRSTDVSGALSELLEKIASADRGETQNKG